MLAVSQNKRVSVISHSEPTKSRLVSQRSRFLSFNSCIYNSSFVKVYRGRRHNLHLHCEVSAIQAPKSSTIYPQRQATYLLTCAPNEDSNQPAHPRSLIRIFVARVKKLCILIYQNAPFKDSDRTAQIRKLF